MESTTKETNAEKQKFTIKILIIVISILVVAFISILIGVTIINKTYYLTLNDCYQLPLSANTYYEIKVENKEEKTLSVSDFTFKHDGDNICASKITYDGKEYSTSEKFILSKNSSNVLVVYITLVNDEPQTIYYKHKAINLFETEKFI